MTEFVLFFVIFLLFSFAVRSDRVQRRISGGEKSELENSRDRSTLRVNDVFELVKNSVDLDDFLASQPVKFDGQQFWINEMTFALSVSKARSELAELNSTFLSACYGFVELHLSKYCELAVQTIRETENVHRSIGFAEGPDEAVFCMITALYDAGIEVDRLFKGAVYFLSIDPQMTYNEAVGKVQNGCRNFVFKKKSTTTGVKELHSSLEYVKTNLTAFSKQFCRRWTPFLSRFLIKMPKSDDIRNEGLFTQHVFHGEKCVVTFKRIRGRGYMQKISSWNCNNVLGSQEYGFNKRGNVVQAKIRPSTKSNSKMRITGIELGPNEFSLGALKTQLKIKSFGIYLNVVKFYNVASDVILLVSIKEGTKVLKGIKHTAGSCTGGVKYISVDESREMSWKLSAFRAAFDELVYLILDKKRIIVSPITEKRISKFHKRVNVIIGLLKTQDNWIHQTMGICSEIPFELNYGDFHLGSIEFEEYYFTNPINHINQLYEFIANRFL